MKGIGKLMLVLCSWRARTVWVLVCVWAGTIFYLSSQSGKNLPKIPWRIPHLDKYVHFAVFAVGGWLVTWALSRWPMPVRRAVLFGIIGVALFGAVDEWHQLYTPGRTGGDLYDWLADLTGAIVGALLAPPVYVLRSLSTGSRAPHPETAAGN